MYTLPVRGSVDGDPLDVFRHDEPVARANWRGLAVVRGEDEEEITSGHPPSARGCPPGGVSKRTVEIAERSGSAQKHDLVAGLLDEATDEGIEECGEGVETLSIGSRRLARTGRHRAVEVCERLVLSPGEVAEQSRHDLL